ncbi:hypothetical protein BGZ65_006185 [Modicella reniformis]|uniref:Protein farnesyltransferase subunit beta n=1 Tax=Modicella reniformis TaxID=1440133 RepID=A0A9P6LXX3_9FUNG|nr:hypothetical protein BGZ65_006185 [Modicella reniformis]
MGVVSREENIQSYKYKDDDFPTESSELQLETEESIRHAFFPYTQESAMPKPAASIELRRTRHVKYLLGAIDSLPSFWAALDASKPWLCYWIIHALDLLEHKAPEQLAQRAISTLSRMQCETGGFAGGPGQEAHLATTYAAVNALTIIGTKEAYDTINRKTLLEFLMRVKQKDGSFKTMVDGEVDVRGSYCAMAVATLTNIVTPELVESAADFIGRCQTYEGGLGGYPGVEAHGGYAFCGLAALELLGRTDVLNMDTFVRWSVRRQMQLEGGFQGRTNKLVDGCYSFWMGSMFPIIGKMVEKLGQDKEVLDFVYDRDAMQEYLLLACQSKSGGLRDKPSNLLWTDNPNQLRVVGLPDNVVESTHPVLNIRLDKVRKAFVYFYGKAAEDVIGEIDVEIIRN